MKISSPEFEHNAVIPDRFTCRGDDTSPPLTIKGVPRDAKSLVLICDDPDAPVGTWDHWIVYDIPADKSEIETGSVPGTQGKNSWGRNDYGGPCPPSGTHRYFFKLFALDTGLGLPEGQSKEVIMKAIEGHVLEKAELIGLYSK